MTWAFLTGEYPPQPGGVSDYTHLVANGLAACGDRVEVWAPECGAESNRNDGVILHRLPGRFGPSALRQLNADLKRIAKPRLLVQYVPHAFGWKAMNIPFCLWLRSRKEPVWSMFHEVCFPRRWNQRPVNHLLGAVTYEMARLIASASERIFYSTSAWLPLLDRFAPSTVKTHLPVPSNVGATADAIPALGPLLIGHFGTYSPTLRGVLAPTFASLLNADPQRGAVFAGRGSAEFRRTFLQGQNSLANRVHAIETESPGILASHIAMCSVMVQPYPDGVTTRRSSLMAGLALGKPVVTNRGPLTEPLWQESGAVALAADMSAASLIHAVEGQLSSASKRTDLAVRATRLYQEKFALSQTVRILRAS